MPFTMTNRGLRELLAQNITGATDLRALVFNTSTPTVAQIRDLNVVSDLLALTTEATASGYTRATLANLTITENDSTDQVTITADNCQWTSVASGETWLGIGYFIHTGANDGVRTLVGVDVPTSSVTTNGGSVTLTGLLITVTGS